MNCPSTTVERIWANHFVDTFGSECIVMHMSSRVNGGPPRSIVPLFYARAENKDEHKAVCSIPPASNVHTTHTIRQPDRSYSYQA